uniref:Uncharacterized protein n=1 Tax=Romanomermis culicivorax TaxID=13658 RepID=A0A915HUH7_ROMCU
MEIPVAVFIFCLSVLQFQCDGQPCTTEDASILNVTKTLLAGFVEIPETDEIRRGEMIFNREQAKFNVSKDYGFLVNEPTIRIKTLIEGWISKSFLDGSSVQNVLNAFNRTLGKKAKGNNRVSTTNSIIDDLRSFVTYKNRKNFNREMASELAQFWSKYDRCRSMIEPA